MTTLLNAIACKLGFHVRSCGDWVALGRICRRTYRAAATRERNGL